MSGGQGDVATGTGQQLVDAEHPWLGLSSFSEQVSSWFYGREAEIRDVSQRVRQRALTVLFGPSGLGKTSLLNAGVLPRLRQAGYQPLLVRVIYDRALEQRSPEQQVLGLLQREYAEFIAAGVRSPESLWEFFHDPLYGLVQESDGGEVLRKRPVLLLDQFEEVFTLGAVNCPQESQEFLEALACVAENRVPESARRRMEGEPDYAERVLQSERICRLVLSLRHDYLHELERYRGRMPSVMDNRFELRRLSGPQAFEAVFNPGLRRRDAGLGGPLLSVPTAEQIVRLVAGVESDVALEKIENVPPLLSLICEQLNSRRLKSGQSTIESADLQGSADEVLRDFVRDSFRDCPLALRDFVEQKLVSRNGIRQSVNIDSAVYDLEAAGVVGGREQLLRLVGRRLLTIEDRGGIARVELTHDILAPVIVKSRDAGMSQQAVQQALAVYDGLFAEEGVDASAKAKRVAEQLFCSLSKKGDVEGKWQCRQLSVQRVAAEAGVEVLLIQRVAVPFIEAGILVQQPPDQSLQADSLLNVEHRTLFNLWRQLEGWLKLEYAARSDYERLAKAAERERQEGLLNEQQLLLYESFWKQRNPAAAWCDEVWPGSFQRVQDFLKRSRNRLQAQKGRNRKILLVLGTASLLLAGLLLWERSRSAWRAEGQNFAARFLASPAAFQEDLLKYRDVALPVLEAAFKQPATSVVQLRERLHAAYGLARYRPRAELLTFLTAQVETLESSEFVMLSQTVGILLKSLGLQAGALVQEQLQQATAVGNRQLELRWLLLGLALGETTRLDAYCGAKSDPSDTTELMVDLAKIPIDVSWLSEVLGDESALQPATRYVLCLVVGGLQGSGVAARATLEELYRTAGDAGTHGAARWALLQQGVSADHLDELIADRAEAEATGGKRDWYVSRPVAGQPAQPGVVAAPGFTMVRIRSDASFQLGPVADGTDPGEDQSGWTAEDKAAVGEFWLSDREVSLGQFRALCPERFQLKDELPLEPGEEPKNLGPMNKVNWYEALIFSNRLSVSHGLEPYYEVDESGYDWEAGRFKDDANFPSIPNPAGTGYRLPTEREWEYACRALSAKSYSFGSE
ncbi:MAG: SUMF1/EgtB/PvdO family nonheme iron enzyme, partial [Planctomycetaceae bacterium]